MTLRTYNGFTGPERSAGGKWYAEELRSGRRKAPTVCVGCGRRRGSVRGHSEDYSQPFGDHIGAFGLCYPCHMAVHCRYRMQKSWAWYRDEVRDGFRFRDTTSYAEFIGWYSRRDRKAARKVRDAQARTWLDGLTLDDGPIEGHGPVAAETKLF